VTSSRVLRDLLVNRARSFIFTTALPPPVAAAALAALEIVAGPEGERRRAILRAHASSLAPRLAALQRSRPGVGDVETVAGSPIHPFIVGTDAAALDLSAALANRRLFVPAIRPPTVPVGTARLRITLSASHTSADLDRLIDALRPPA
jgi:8-amino-7-oxononanoate synthase